MAFADTLKELPFTPRTANGSGFLPPMFRGGTHITYLLGCLSDDKTTVTPEEALAELTAAREHWNARVTTPAISTAAAGRATTILRLIDDTITEYNDWAEDSRIANVRDLSHRVGQYMADLDRELVGIPNSDPGTSL
jgi:hypothetical protein